MRLFGPRAAGLAVQASVRGSVDLSAVVGRWFVGEGFPKSRSLPIPPPCMATRVHNDVSLPRPRVTVHRNSSRPLSINDSNRCIPQLPEHSTRTSSRRVWSLSFPRARHTQKSALLTKTETLSIDTQLLSLKQNCKRSPEHCVLLLRASSE